MLSVFILKSKILYSLFYLSLGNKKGKTEILVLKVCMTEILKVQLLKEM